MPMHLRVSIESITRLDAPPGDDLADLVPRLAGQPRAEDGRERGTGLVGGNGELIHRAGLVLVAAFGLAHVPLLVRVGHVEHGSAMGAVLDGPLLRGLERRHLATFFAGGPDGAGPGGGGERSTASRAERRTASPGQGEARCPTVYVGRGQPVRHV